MATNRRSFLKTAGLATAVASAAPLALSMGGDLTGGASPVLAADKRAYTAGKYALELDGKSIGILNAYGGGFPYGEVVEFRDGSNTDPFARKHIGNVKYEEISMVCGLNMEKALWDWVSAMLSGKAGRKSGAIIAADFNYKEVSRLEFRDALITEVSFPAMDGASKEAGYITIVLSPEQTTYKKASGGKITVSAQKQKQWLTSNFRLKLGDLPCSRVSKIDSFTIKQGITEFRPGEEREPVKVPGKLEFPNLVIALSEADGDAWFKKFDDFVLNGNNGDEQELEGALEYLAPNLKAVLGTLSFSHLGIIRCEPEGSEAASDAVRRIKAEFYVEEMRFTLGSPAALAE